jgi:hypothetical protein
VIFSEVCNPVPGSQGSIRRESDTFQKCSVPAQPGRVPDQELAALTNPFHNLFLILNKIRSEGIVDDTNLCACKKIRFEMIALRRLSGLLAFLLDQPVERASCITHWAVQPQVHEIGSAARDLLLTAIKGLLVSKGLFDRIPAIVVAEISRMQVCLRGKVMDKICTVHRSESGRTQHLKLSWM